MENNKSESGAGQVHFGTHGELRVLSYSHEQSESQEGRPPLGELTIFFDDASGTQYGLLVNQNSLNDLAELNASYGYPVDAITATTALDILGLPSELILGLAQRVNHEE